MVSGGESDPEEPVPSERGEEELGGRRELGILLGISASPGGTLAAAEPSDAQRHRLQMLGAIGAFIGNAGRETRQIVAHEMAMRRAKAKFIQKLQIMFRMIVEAGDLAHRALVYENSLGATRVTIAAIRSWRLSCLLSSSRSRGRRARVQAALKKWRLEAQARHDRARRAHAFLRRPVAAAAAPATARADRPAERRVEPRRRTFDRTMGGELVENDRWWHAALDEMQAMMAQKAKEMAAMAERVAVLEHAISTANLAVMTAATSTRVTQSAIDSLSARVANEHTDFGERHDRLARRVDTAECSIAVLTAAARGRRPRSASRSPRTTSRSTSPAAPATTAGGGQAATPAPCCASAATGVARGAAG